jgi:hypothetical protein
MGAGDNDGKQFMHYDDPSLFLHPIIFTLHDHFPVDDSKNFISFNYTYETFLMHYNIAILNMDFIMNHIHFLNLIVQQGF